MGKVNWAYNYALCTIPIIMFGIGRWFERMETNRMTMFRDKSALYGRELKPGEEPSWPKPNFPLYL